MFVVIAAVVAYSTWSLGPPTAGLLGALAALAWLAFAACFWPFVPCPAPLCDKGKVRRPGKRKAYRTCGWCHGKGARVRWFRRFYDEVRPTKHRRR